MSIAENTIRSQNPTSAAATKYATFTNIQEKKNLPWQPQTLLNFWQNMAQIWQILSHKIISVSVLYVVDNDTIVKET